MKELEVEKVSIDTLSLDEANARTHSQRNLDSIAASLKKFSQVKPIVVKGTKVIAGNGTLMAAKQLGWKTIAITRVPDSWTEQEAKAYAIADNRTAELAAWDEETLLETLRSLDDSLALACGFSDMDMKALEAIYGEIPEGFEGRISDPNLTPITGKVISLKVSDDTFDKWKETWDTLDGDDDARVNQILDVMP